MKLKKANAILALLSILLLMAHIIRNVYNYATLTYDPFFAKILAQLTAIAVCLHAILGMCLVFLQGDGTRLDLYPKLNRRTIVQRVSAAFILPLLLVHIQTFTQLKTASENGQWLVFVLILLLQLCLYLTSIAHVATSLTKALITLGWLTSLETQKRLDWIIYRVGAVLFVIATIVVTRADLIMFVH